MENTSKKEPTNNGNGKSIFSYVEEGIKVDKLFNEGLPVRYVPYVLYVAFLGVLYIANTHNADRLSRNYEKTKREVEDLRTDYTTLKADYMFESKQSEVAKRVYKMGLIEDQKSPYKVIVIKE